MTDAWRIVKRRLAKSAFDGEGARLYGGRWNSPGRSAVYVSESRALAALEVLAGLGSVGPVDDYVLIRVRFDEALVVDVDLAKLEDGWDARPPTPVSQGVGDRWLSGASSAVLRVPSVIVPAESNYVLDPAHPDFEKIEVGKPEDFGLDPRLRSR